MGYWDEALALLEDVLAVHGWAVQEFPLSHPPPGRTVLASCSKEGLEVSTGMTANTSLNASSWRIGLAREFFIGDRQGVRSSPKRDI